MKKETIRERLLTIATRHHEQGNISTRLLWHTEALNISKNASNKRSQVIAQLRRKVAHLGITHTRREQRIVYNIYEHPLAQFKAYGPYWHD